MGKSRLLGLLLGVGLIWSLCTLAVARDSAASGTTEDPAEVKRSLALLKTGTKISTELDATIDAHVAKPGDFIFARVTRNVKRRGHKVVRKGDLLLGRISSVELGSKYQAGSQLRVTFIRLIRGNAAYLFNTVVSSVNSTADELAARNKMSLMDEPNLGGGPRITSGQGPAGGPRTYDGAGGYWRGGTVTQGNYININGAPPSAENRNPQTSGFSTDKAAAAILPPSDPDHGQDGSRRGFSTPKKDIRVSSQPSAIQGGPTASILGSRVGGLRLRHGARIKFKVSTNPSLGSSKR